MSPGPIIGSHCKRIASCRETRRPWAASGRRTAGCGPRIGVLASAMRSVGPPARRATARAALLALITLVIVGELVSAPAFLQVPRAQAPPQAAAATEQDEA